MIGNIAKVVRRVAGRGATLSEVDRVLDRADRYGASPTVEVPTPTFAIGTGRSGTHFMHQLMSEDPGLASYHTDTLRQNVGDSFTRYCAWNELPVDYAEFIEARRRLMVHHAARGRRYFESNSYVSLCVTPLHAAFGSRFLLMTRRPDRVVNSHYVKGWYDEVPPRADVDFAHGFQYGARRANHAFRILPRGAEFERWRELTRIGRIAWMWNAYYLRTLDELVKLPSGEWEQVRLEEVDYPRYLELHERIGGRQPLTGEKFDSIRRARPGKASRQRSIEDWRERERAEFLEETAPARRKLHYEDF